MTRCWSGEDCTNHLLCNATQVCERDVAERLESSDASKLVVAFDLPDEPFPLEIGAGERPTPGFIHNDIRPLPDIEVVCDAGEQLVHVIGPGRVSELRACHVLEHFPYEETIPVLGYWKTLLTGGGRVHIEVPNMGWQTNAHSRGEITDEEFVYYAYGEQNYSGNFHCAGFTSNLLAKRLEQAGFENVNVTDIGQVLIATATNPLQ